MPYGVYLRPASQSTAHIYWSVFGSTVPLLTWFLLFWFLGKWLPGLDHSAQPISEDARMRYDEEQMRKQREAAEAGMNTGDGETFGSDAASPEAEEKAKPNHKGEVGFMKVFDMSKPTMEVYLIKH